MINFCYFLYREGVSFDRWRAASILEMNSGNAIEW